MNDLDRLIWEMEKAYFEANLCHALGRQFCKTHAHGAKTEDR